MLSTDVRFRLDRQIISELPVRTTKTGDVQNH